MSQESIYGEILRQIMIDYRPQFDSSKICDMFCLRLKSLTKLSINYDISVIDIIINLIEKNQKPESYSTELEKITNAMKKLIEGLDKIKFINKRGLLKVEKIIERYSKNPIYKLINLIKTLATAINQDDFRYDFFQVISQSPDVENQDWVKDQYIQFWTQAIQKRYPRDLLIQLDTAFNKFQKRAQILPPKLISQIDQMLGDCVGTSKRQMQLNQQLFYIAENNSLDNQITIKQNLREQYLMLSRILQKFSGLSVFTKELKVNMHLHQFGSLISGFAGKDSDLDITILTDSYINQVAFLGYLADFLEMEMKQQQKSGKRYTVNFIPTASIPLVSLKISALRGKYDVRIDILVNNVLGVINSKMLYVYSRIRWVKHMGILVKLWAKKHRIIDKQCLSSYSIILMLISFLLKKQKIKLAVDARGRSQDSAHFSYKRIKNGESEVFDVFYKFKHQPSQLTELSRANIIDLLKQFMHYYSPSGEHWKQSQEEQIISVDGTKNKKFQVDYVFTIKDPFDEPHNPGRAKIADKAHILEKFKEAYEKLKQGDLSKIKDLF